MPSTLTTTFSLVAAQPVEPITLNLYSVPSKPVLLDIDKVPDVAPEYTPPFEMLL